MSTPIVAELNPGGRQTLLLLSNGTVWTWGLNNYDQLGTGAAALYSSVPEQVDLPPIVQVAGGARYSMALAADGTTIYTWGDNARGELGIGSSAVASSPTPVAINLDLPPGVTVVSIASGLNTAYALLSTGQVMAWGLNLYAQAGNNPYTSGAIIYQPTIIPGLADVTSISAGDRDAMALTSDGTVWAWGENNYGQLGPMGSRVPVAVPGVDKPAEPWTSIPVEVTGLPPVEMIASGGNQNIVVDDSGNIWTWGRNEFGELGWGTVDPDNGPHSRPRMVRGLSNIVSIDSEGPTTLAADASGQVYAFGDNRFGEVGDGTVDDTGTPTMVFTMPISPDVVGPSVQVAAGHFFSFAFNSMSGEVYAWGENSSGELGVSADRRPNPNPIDITAILPPDSVQGPVTVIGAVSMAAGNQDVTWWGMPALGTVSIAAGDGNDLISLPIGTTYIVSLGNGLDTVNANGSGTVFGGSGDTLFFAGGASGDANVIASHGASDTIVAGAGAVTICGYGADPLIFGGAGSLDYIGDASGDPTVLGGSGTATLFAGAGQNLTYLTGLQDAAGASLLLAGAGAETLDAGGATVGVRLAAGVGTAVLIGSSGNDEFFGGSGVASMTGNGGHDIFAFASASEPGGQHGGISIITDFDITDDVFATIGYGNDAAQIALLAATVSGGNTTAKLFDGTTIEFLGITNPGAILVASS